VRHDRYHAREFFSLLLPALVVLPYRPGRRAFGLAAVLATLLVLLAIAGERLDRVVDPFERAGDAWGDVTTLVRPGERHLLLGDGRNRVREGYALHPDVVSALEGHTVHVEPYETAVVWAYDLDWKPLPVFHGYQAYTAELDRLNADQLLASDAPSRVLLGKHEAIDLRVGGWESPAAVRALLCRYQALVQRDAWLVLGRAEDRCGPERPLGERTARWGEAVHVPPPSPDGMVFVRLHGVGPRFGERVRSALHKGYERHVSLDGGRRLRLVPGTAGNGLLLHAPSGVELPEGFRRAPGPTAMSVLREGDPGGTLRYEFFLVPVAR
jgi:hypothetical protein